MPTPPTSLWTATTPATAYPALEGEQHVDVAVVGAGVTGITAATLLQRAGLTVALLDKGPIVGGETGHTTSHLTVMVDTRYARLLSSVGEDGVRIVAQSNAAAIDLIESLVAEQGGRGRFRRVPAFLYTESPRDRRRLEQEHEAMARAGIRSVLTMDVPLPFRVAGAIRLEGQAQVHPREYLVTLVERFAAQGGRVHENTRMLDVEDGEPCRLHTDRGLVLARDVVVATNVPVSTRFLLHTKIAPYRTYVVALRAGHMPPPGLYWDTEDPYHYTRTQDTDQGTWLLVGGEDHKVGQEPDTWARFDALERYARERFGGAEVGYRWSGQVIEPVDGLPYIGPSSGARHVFVATGYSGNGITFGTAAGMLLSDLVLRLGSPWAELYDATRVRPLSGALTWVAENVDYPTHMIVDRLWGADAGSIEEVPPGEGRIVATSQGRLAVFREPGGGVHAMSPVCPHMGCHVDWNAAERSWDCPCHGSRFDARGALLNGPAVTDLEPRTLG